MKEALCTVSLSIINVTVPQNDKANFNVINDMYLPITNFLFFIFERKEKLLCTLSLLFVDVAVTQRENKF